MEAVVLYRRDFRENDQIISFYTKEQGKVELLVRGVKKITSKLSGNLTPGNIIDIDIAVGKEIDHLTKINSAVVWKNINHNLSKIVLINRSLYLFNKLIKGSASDYNLFYFLTDWIKYIDSINIASKLLFSIFIVKLTKYLGFEPKLDSCYQCNSHEGLVKFNLSSGLICYRCYDSLDNKINTINITSQNIKIYRNLLAEDFDKINVSNINSQLVNIINSFIQFHYETKLKILN